MTRKIALITGASRGLGRSAALHLARAGVEVIGTYNNSAEAAAETRRDIEALGVRAAMLPFDADGAICAEAFERGLIIETSGADDEVVKVLAPLTTSEETFQKGFDILRESVATSLNNHKIAAE